jgi:hypothetical protein
MYCSNSVTCLSCQSGYYLNSNASECVACTGIDPFCIICNVTNCLQCLAGYYSPGVNQPC